MCLNKTFYIAIVISPLIILILFLFKPDPLYDDCDGLHLSVLIVDPLYDDCDGLHLSVLIAKLSPDRCTWSVADVGFLLRLLDLDDYHVMFQQHQVDGETLLDLTPVMLRQTFAMKSEHIVKLGLYLGKWWTMRRR